MWQSAASAGKDVACGKKSARKNQQECEVLKGQEKISFNNSDVVTSVIIIVFL